jgi:hypothetical protein
VLLPAEAKIMLILIAERMSRPKSLSVRERGIIANRLRECMETIPDDEAKIPSVDSALPKL